MRTFRLSARKKKKGWLCYKQGAAKRQNPGLVNLVPAVVYQFCLALPEALTQPGAHLIAYPCIMLICYIADDDGSGQNGTGKR